MAVNYSLLQMGMQPQQFGLQSGGVQDASGIQGNFALARYDRQMAALAHSGNAGGGGGGGVSEQMSLKDQELAQKKKESELALINAQTAKIGEERRQLALQGDYNRYGENLKKSDPGMSEAYKKSIQMYVSNFMKSSPAVSAAFGGNKAPQARKAPNAPAATNPAPGTAGSGKQGGK